MTTTKHLLESASLATDAPNADGTWKVRLISEGQGSSGYYPGEMLESYHSALDNCLSFQNHPEDGPHTRNFTQIVGRVVGETWVEKDEDGLVGVYGNYQPDPDFKPKLEMYKDQLGLSIFIEGDGREDENGNFLVESFNGDDPYKSVDVVIAAGRGGRFEESLKKIYSDRVSESENKPGVDSAQDTNTKEQHMTPEQLKELTESIAKAVVESLAPLKEALAAKDEKQVTVEEALAAYAETVKAIDEADLFPSQAESLKARAAKGEDVTDAIAEAKKIKDEATKAVAESKTDPVFAGRVLGESKSTGDYAGPTAWGSR